MEEVSLDAIGPLCDDGEGNKYIIVMIDNFSRRMLLGAAEVGSRSVR